MASTVNVAKFDDEYSHTFAEESRQGGHANLARAFLKDARICIEGLGLTEHFALQQIEPSRTETMYQLTRWGCTLPPELVALLYDPDKGLAPGALLPDAMPERYRARKARGYTCGTVQNFCNTPSPSLVLTKGTVHVTVGLVDLSILLHAGELRPDERGGKPLPLRFVGYDMSPFVVAKSKVIVEMIRAGAPAGAVLQVWWSSGWTRDAKTRFREAAAAALKVSESSGDVSHGKRAGGDGEAGGDSVLGLLRHWARELPDVDLEQSRRLWLSRHSSEDAAVYPLANLANKVDRVEMARYMVTGELGAAAEVGSTAMFSRPAGSPASSRDENAFYSFPVDELLMDSGAVGMGIMDMTLAWLERRIERLAGWVSKGEVDLTFHAGAVAMEPGREARAIRKEIRPWTPTACPGAT